MNGLPMVMIEPVVRAALLEDLGRAGDPCLYSQLRGSNARQVLAVYFVRPSSRSAMMSSGSSRPTDSRTTSGPAPGRWRAPATTCRRAARVPPWSTTTGRWTCSPAGRRPTGTSSSSPRARPRTRSPTTTTPPSSTDPAGQFRRGWLERWRPRRPDPGRRLNRSSGGGP